MLHNSEGATLTDHMHEICFYYEKKKKPQQHKNRTQVDLYRGS